MDVKLRKAVVKEELRKAKAAEKAIKKDKLRKAKAVEKARAIAAALIKKRLDL